MFEILYSLKRRMALICCIIFAFCSSIGGFSAAVGGSVDIGTAKSALLIDASSGKILFEANASEKLPVAGLTRLAPLLVICDAFDTENISGSEKVTISGAAVGIGGTTAFLREGELIDAESLLLAAAMINAGDATHALAGSVCGSDSAALEAISARLLGLGIEQNFADICGTGQPLSAIELAAIASELIKSPTYSRYGTKFYEHIEHDGAGETELANPNKLIKQYSGCLGVGTGSSKEAGYCGVFAAKRGETCYIAVVLGAQGGAERFTLGRDLLDYGFSAFRSVRVCGAGEAFGNIRVNGSMTPEINAEAGDDTRLLISTSDKEYKIETDIPEVLDAPIAKGDTVGMLTIRGADGEMLAETPLVADRNASEAEFIDCLRLVLKRYLKFL